MSQTSSGPGVWWRHLWSLTGGGPGTCWRTGSVKSSQNINLDLTIDFQVYPAPSNDTLQLRGVDKAESGRAYYGQLTGITCYLLGLFIRIGLDLSK